MRIKHLWIALAIAALSSFGGCAGCGANTQDQITRVDTSDPVAVENEIAKINDQVKASTSATEKVDLLQKGHQLAVDAGKEEEAISYAVALIKEGSDNQKDMLLYLAESMNEGKTKPEAQLIIQGLLDRYADDKEVQAAKSMLESPILDKDAYIAKIAESVFENPDRFGINFANAQKYVDICEAYALVYPNDKRTPEYLYKASEIAVAIRTYSKSLNLYDWLIDFYPDYAKTPNALFAKGYLLDEELNKRELAKAAFSKFLETYPNHELADDAKFLLENIGKSGDEIIQIIEAEKAKREAN